MIGYSVAMLCLSLNVYHEAGNQSLIGKQAVADVVVNRAVEENKNVCQIVLEPHQFSWVTGHNVKYLERDKKILLHKVKGNDAEKEAWNESQSVAALALSKGYIPRYRFTQYHTTAVHPYWSRHVKEVKIGSHLFSRRKSCKTKCTLQHSLPASLPVASSTPPKHVMTTGISQMMKWSSPPKYHPAQLLQPTVMAVSSFPRTWEMAPQLPPFTVETMTAIGEATDETCNSRNRRNYLKRFINWLRKL